MVVVLHGFLLLAGLHDLTRLAGFYCALDVSIYSRPKYGLPCPTFRRLYAAVAGVELGECASAISSRYDDSLAVQNQLPIGREAVSDFPVGEQRLVQVVSVGREPSRHVILEVGILRVDTCCFA